MPFIIRATSCLNIFNLDLVPIYALIIILNNQHNFIINYLHVEIILFNSFLYLFVEENGAKISQETGNGEMVNAKTTI